VYLKYSVNKTGTPEKAEFIIYYKATSTFPANPALKISSQVFAIIVTSSENFNYGVKTKVADKEGRYVGMTGGIGYKFGDYVHFGA
jgi:hypothetical protein